MLVGISFSIILAQLGRLLHGLWYLAFPNPNTQRILWMHLSRLVFYFIWRKSVVAMVSPGLSRGVWCFRLLYWFLDLRASYFFVAVSFWRQYEFHFIQPLGSCFRMEERCVGFLPSDVTFPRSRAYFIAKQCHIYCSAARSHLAIQRLIAIDGNHVRLQAAISEVGIRWAIIEAWIDLTIWRIWIRPGCKKTSSLGFVAFRWEGGDDWLIATWL